MSLRVLLACVILLGACGDDGPVEVPDAAEGPPWWTPEPAEYRNWDIQLYDVAAAFDLSAPRDMYVLDLFQVVPGPTTLDYDGTPITFPAGKLPTAIADLHARGVIVVCRVNVGAMRPTDPDAAQYPAVIVGELTGDPNAADERFVDIRPAMRPMWTTALTRRIELAKMIGCDAIDADKSLQSSGIQPGWTVDFDDQKAFHLAVADIAHRADLQLSVGLRNGLSLGSDADVSTAYDFTIVEGMAEGTCCDEVRPFIDERKAAFALDYLSRVTVDGACIQYNRGGMRDGILKDDGLSSLMRETCP